MPQEQQAAARLEELGIVTPHSWGWTHTGTAAELRASERITAVEIFNHVAQHAATPVPPLLPPPLQDLSPTPNSSSGQTDRSGCQKLGTPQDPAALPTTLAPPPASCSPGTPLTRNPRRYALPRLEARTDEAVWKTQPPERRGKERWSPGRPVLTVRGARAAQPEPQQRPQRGGTQSGHLRGRSQSRSAWGAGPDQEPGSRVLYPAPAARRVLELPLRRPCTPRSQAAARSLAESFWLRRASRRPACPSASASSHREAPPQSPPRAQGFPAERSAGPLRAEESERAALRTPPARPPGPPGSWERGAAEAPNIKH